MILNNIVVTYTIRPDARDEHIRLIEAVFAQLKTDGPGNVDYQVLCLDDGVTFVHISTAETIDGKNPLPELSSFKEFNKNIAERVTTKPAPSSSNIIGQYRGRS